MATVIRDAGTSLFRKADGIWVKDWERAEQFASIGDALNACRKYGLQSFQIVTKHADQPGFEDVSTELCHDHKERKVYTRTRFFDR